MAQLSDLLRELADGIFPDASTLENPTIQRLVGDLSLLWELELDFGPPAVTFYAGDGWE